MTAGFHLPSRTRIKICGVRDVATAQVCVEAGADAIGLMFAPRSPRAIDLHTASEIAAALPPFVTPVAVFQNASIEDDELAQWQGDWVQLHGDEDEAYIAQVRRGVIRGFRFDPDALRRWDACPGVDALLVDGSAGGEGTSFAHEELVPSMKNLSKPVILAGGLTPDNVADAVRDVRPYAVDVSSGVERAPGEKDHDRIRAFCAAVRDADAAG
jgi:phosphoribosylanthranilate isomerase